MTTTTTTTALCGAALCHVLPTPAARRAAARTALGCDRLPAGLGDELDAAHARCVERARLEATPGPAGEPVTRRWPQVRRDRIAAPLRAAYQRCGYRAAAHGHDLVIRVGAYSAPGASSDVGHVRPQSVGLPNCYAGYSVAQSEHVLTVRDDYRECVVARGVDVVDGMLTLDARPAPHPLRPGESLLAATWVRQGRGTALAVERGYLYQSAPGAGWTHCETLRAVRRAQGPVVAVGDRLRASAARGVSLALAIRAGRACGLCAAGVRDWAERHAPGRERISLDELRSLVSETSDRHELASRLLDVLDPAV